MSPRWCHPLCLLSIECHTTKFVKTISKIACPFYRNLPYIRLTLPMSDVYQHSVRASKFLRLKSSASLKKSNSFSMESQPSEKNYSMMEPSNINLLLPEEQKSTNIENPHHNDVLCGRGVTTNRHPGNESFRSLVGLNKVSAPKIISRLSFSSPLLQFA